jgi:hypothetical protein
MSSIRRLPTALGAFLLSAACSSASQSTPSAMGNPNLITEQEIHTQMNAGVRNVHELVERLRPRWLQLRGERSINLGTAIVVYHNQQAIGGPDSMRSFDLTNIRSIRYLDSAQAGQLPGTSGTHVQAAIVISTAR